jgi:hypothetical protein
MKPSFICVYKHKQKNERNESNKKIIITVAGWDEKRNEFLFVFDCIIIASYLLDAALLL